MRMTRGHVRGVTRGMEVIYMRMTRGHVRGVNVNYSQSLCPKLSISIKVEPEAILEEEVDARALHYIHTIIDWKRFIEQGDGKDDQEDGSR